MILHPVDDDDRTAHSLNDPTQIRKQIGPQIRLDERLSFLGAENQMYN
jgi:hypothetical protein